MCNNLSLFVVSPFATVTRCLSLWMYCVMQIMSGIPLEHKRIKHHHSAIGNTSWWSMDYTKEPIDCLFLSLQKMYQQIWPFDLRNAFYSSEHAMRPDSHQTFYLTLYCYFTSGTKTFFPLLFFYYFINFNLSFLFLTW